MEIQSYTHDAGGWSQPLAPSSNEHLLVTVFGASSYVKKEEPFAELRKVYPKATFIGCSTAGEIAQDRVQDESLSVAVTEFTDTNVRLASAKIDNAAASEDAGREIAEALAGEGLRGVFVLSDGLHVNGSALVRGINAVVPTGVVVTGGLAGDGDRFANTWVFDGDSPRSGIVAAVGFYGESVHIGHGSKGGWDRFGPQRKVTRSEGNVLYELDGKPALTLYKEYLGDQAAGLPASGLLFPLVIRHPDSPDKALVRTILSVDEDNQSMTFAGDLPEGCQAALMHANFDRLVDGAEGAALMTKQNDTGDTPTLAIAISCVGRRLVLGERTEEEIEATLEALPENTTQVGFYSYGELSPYGVGSCDLHNQTMTLTTITER